MVHQNDNQNWLSHYTLSVNVCNWCIFDFYNCMHQIEYILEKLISIIWICIIINSMTKTNSFILRYISYTFL